MPRNFFLINLILLIIVGLLGFKFYKVWMSPLDIPTRTTQRQFQADKKSLGDRKVVNLDEAAYDVIVQKDLFRPSRSAAPHANALKPSSSKEVPKLFGTMIMNNKNFAILEDPFTKTTKLYHVNDAISGFIVSDIQKDKVILKRGDKSIEVKLRDMKGFKSPSSLHLPKPQREPKKRKPRRPRPQKRRSSVNEVEGQKAKK